MMPAEIRQQATDLFIRASRRHERQIKIITDHGYGAYLFGLLAREAWICAQKNCEIRWPDDRIEPIKAWKRLDNAPTPLPSPAIYALTIPMEVMAWFDAGRFAAEAISE